MTSNESGQATSDFDTSAIAVAEPAKSARSQNRNFEPTAALFAPSKEKLDPIVFQDYGGTTTAQEMADLMRSHVDQSVSKVARWIASQQVVAFRWQGELLLPLFQFDLAHMHVRAGIDATLSELAGLMDEEECASWFVQPNSWTDGEAPAAVIASAPDAVVAAARAYRFVVTG